jgi:Uma2 family endonuclease
MVHPVPVGRMTVEEYFDFEEQQTSAKHEYVDGEVFAMAGPTRRHNTIAGNIYMRLRTAARGGPCRVHIAEVKLRADPVIYYPDVVVACGAAPEDERIEDAPCLVVEVLSPSTQATDRREKLLVYKRMPSIRGYYIVDQMQRRVDAHVRRADGTWAHQAVVEQGSLPVPCTPLDVMLTLDEIYEDVTLPTPEERLRLREEEAAYL